MFSNPVDFVLPRIRRMRSYIPGFQPKDPAIIKLNSNENPFPISENVKAALLREIESGPMQKYPDPSARTLREKLAAKHSQSPENFIIGNGSDEILSILFRCLLEDEEVVVTANPTYSLYPVLAQMTGAAISEIDLRDDWHMDFNAMLAQTASRLAKLTIIANPNAPTGLAESAADILDFAERNKGLTLVDEAYVDFGAQSVAKYAGSEKYPRLLVCGTFSKAYSLAGARLGWLAAAKELCVEFEKIKDSYNVSRLAQAAGAAALDDEAEIQRRHEIVKQVREKTTTALRSSGFHCLDSSANFIFASPPGKDAHREAEAYFKFLEGHGILIRYFSSPRCRDFVRITIGTDEQMKLLLQRTEEFLSERKSTAV